MRIDEWNARYVDRVQSMSDEALAVAAALARREVNVTELGRVWREAVEEEVRRRRADT